MNRFAVLFLFLAGCGTSNAPQPSESSRVVELTERGNPSSDSQAVNSDTVSRVPAWTTLYEPKREEFRSRFLRSQTPHLQWTPGHCVLIVDWPTGGKLLIHIDVDYCLDDRLWSKPTALKNRGKAHTGDALPDVSSSPTRSPSRSLAPCSVTIDGVVTCDPAPLSPTCIPK